MPPSDLDPDVSSSTPSPSPEALVYIRMLLHTEADTRQRAAEELGALREPAAFEALRDALFDSQQPVRAAAAQGLGLLGDLRAVLPLCTAYSRWGAHRGDAARALWQIEGVRLPYRVLTSTSLTPVQKLTSLQGLAHISLVMSGQDREMTAQGYSIGDLRLFCEKLCRQPDTVEDVRRGAEAVLRELRRQKESDILLRASSVENVTPTQELLRTASGQNPATPPGELLRSSSNTLQPVGRKRRGLLARLLQRIMAWLRPPKGEA